MPVWKLLPQAGECQFPAAATASQRLTTSYSSSAESMTLESLWGRSFTVRWPEDRLSAHTKPEKRPADVMDARHAARDLWRSSADGKLPRMINA
jgi:hypothetical protein